MRSPMEKKKNDPSKTDSSVFLLPRVCAESSQGLSSNSAAGAFFYGVDHALD